MNLRHLLHAKRWVQNPPSWRRVKFVFAIVLICLIIAGIDWLGYWPDWARVEKMKRPF